jgi:hypothetical protein
MVMAVVLAVADAVPAQEVTVDLDPIQTEVAFTLSDVLHTVHGNFKLKSGTTKFNAASGAAGGLVVIDATSGESGNRARDQKMHKNVLLSQQYPEITFSPGRIKGTVIPQGDSDVAIAGIMKLDAQDHEITLNARVHIAGDHITATTNFVIPYVQWGLKNPSTFLLRVSDKVQITVQTAGHVSGLSARP